MGLQFHVTPNRQKKTLAYNMDNKLSRQVNQRTVFIAAHLGRINNSCSHQIFVISGCSIISILLVVTGENLYRIDMQSIIERIRSPNLEEKK